MPWRWLPPRVRGWDLSFPGGNQQPGWEGKLWQQPPKLPAPQHRCVPAPALGRVLVVLPHPAGDAALPCPVGFRQVHTGLFTFLLLQLFVQSQPS